jgi:hypothetical protein
MRSSIASFCALISTGLARASIARVALARVAAAVARASSVVVLAACNDELVESVPTDVCASGQRWVGEVTASEEMFPGQDCLSCHRALDGPEFIAAGTVYGLPDPDGARTVNPFCFGVEGARVSITGADGTVLQTRSNRAGNFFFEGPEDALAKPFSVEIDYTLADGRVTRQSMKTRPSYGGCAHCHDPNLPGTPGVLPGGKPAPSDVVEGAYPIFTGPLYQ